MQYPATAYLNLIFLFLGAAIGSLFCILAGKIFKKKYFKFRLSLTFLLLAAAFVFIALMLLKTGKTSHNFKIIFNTVQTRILALSIYAGVGVLCAAFLRTFLPFVAVLYIAFTFCFGATLYKQLPPPESIALTVNETFVRNEATGEEYKFNYKEKKGEEPPLCYLVFYVYELNENTVFLLPHIWFKLRCVLSEEQMNSLPPAFKYYCQEADLSDYKNVPSFTVPFSDEKPANEVQRFFIDLCKKILGEPRAEFVKIPVQQVYPSLFNLKIQTEGSNFNTVLERIM